MLNNLIDDSSYINFLYYGIDLVSAFPASSKITVYKNKYKRLSNSVPKTNTYQLNTALLLYKTVVSILKYSNIPYIDEHKLKYIETLLEIKSYSKLIFNNIISISIIEINIFDDSQWKQIKDTVLVYLNLFKDFIHDDSSNENRILSLDIPVIEYDYNKIIPDVTDYNIDILSQYANVLNDEYAHSLYYMKYNDEFTNKFTSELKYLIKTDKVVTDGAYESLLKKNYTDLVIDGNVEKLRMFYHNIIGLITSDNISLIITLQYKLFKKIFSSLYHKLDDELDVSSFLRMFICLDIFICNKALMFCDKETCEDVFKTYNYYIIKLQDIIDETDLNNDVKNTFVFMYKNQLFKSRNKIRDKLKEV